MKENKIRRSLFSYKIASELKYGLHFSAVISRRDPLVGGAIEVLKKCICARKVHFYCHGLHFSTVISRRGPLAGGAIEVTVFLTYASKASIFYEKAIDYIYICRIHPAIAILSAVH